MKIMQFMLDHAHKIITVLAILILVFTILIFVQQKKEKYADTEQKKFSESTNQALMEECRDDATKACQDAYNKYFNGKPEDNDANWAAFEACKNNAYNVCGCQHKDTIKDKCELHQKKGESRTVGCYSGALSADDQQKCFEDPEAFFCADGPTHSDYYCNDIKAQCSGFCDESLLPK